MHWSMPRVNAAMPLRLPPRAARLAWTLTTTSMPCIGGGSVKHSSVALRSVTLLAPDRPGNHAGILRRRKLCPRREGSAGKSWRDLCPNRGGRRAARRSRHGDSQSGARLGSRALRRQSVPPALRCDDHPRQDAGQRMQGRTLRSVPLKLCEALARRCQLERGRASRGLARTVSEGAGHARAPRGGDARMGYAVANLARREPAIEVDFALIGHQESWRAAADILAVLRGGELTALPDDE